MNIQGKVAIVTGGSQGIGRGMTEALLNRGASVVIADIKDGTAVVQELNSKYRKNVVIYQKCDVTKTSDNKACINTAIREFGRFDILVNNAGVGGTSFWDDQDLNKAHFTIDVDLIAVMDFTRLAVQHWNKDPNSKGSVVNVASNMAFFPAGYDPIYGAAKAAVVHFTSTCASLFPKIKVNAVAPNYAATEMYLKATELSNVTNVANMNGVLTIDEVVAQMVRCIEDPQLFGDTIKLIANKEPLVHKQRKAARL
ncbi:hypothetical protein BB561_004818 [Smittium simulii]|uniref:Uncharacterized protein n=1 Tax=Smittium simulii TaxID=133385 RepID=A0A2T9YE02_9FUNG|nr:hypothetical protein BB561_004818 [Smittium simulii]